jgi:hypothetical protein
MRGLGEIQIYADLFEELTLTYGSCSDKATTSMQWKWNRDLSQMMKWIVNRVTGFEVSRRV